MANILTESDVCRTEVMDFLDFIGRDKVESIILDMIQLLTEKETNYNRRLWKILNSMLKFKCEVGDDIVKYDVVDYKQVVHLCLNEIKQEEHSKDLHFSILCSALYHSLLLLQNDVFKSYVTNILTECVEDLSLFVPRPKVVDENKSLTRRSTVPEVNLRILETVVDVLLKRNVTHPHELETFNTNDVMNTVILNLLTYGVEHIAGKTALAVLRKWLMFTNDDHLIKSIWTNIITNFNNKAIDLSNTFQTLCILIEFCLSYGSKNIQIGVSIVEDNYFWNILQQGLTHSDPLVRKQALYLMKRTCDGICQNKIAVNVLCRSAVFKWNPADSNRIWEQLFLVMETLEEKQVHLIKPVLHVIDNLSDMCLGPDGNNVSLHVSWLICVFHKVINHDNMSVVKWGILNFIRVYTRRGLHTVSHESSVIQDFLGPFMNAINNSALYSRTSEDTMLTEIGEALKDLFEHIILEFTHEDCCIFFRCVLNAISRISWAPVPLFNVTHALSSAPPVCVWSKEELTILKDFISQALGCQYVFIRGAIQCMLLNAAINFADTNSIDIHVVADFLGSLRSEESLKRGTVSWFNTVEWLKKFVKRDDAIRFVIVTLPASDIGTERVQLSTKTVARIIILLCDSDKLLCNTGDGSFTLTTYLQSLLSCFQDCEKRLYASQTTQEYSLELISCLLTESHALCHDRTGDVVRKTITGYVNSMLDQIFVYFHRRMFSITHLQDFHVADIHLTALSSFIAEASNLPNMKSSIMKLQDSVMELLETPNTPPMCKYFCMKILSHISCSLRKCCQCTCGKTEVCVIYEKQCVLISKIIKNGRLNVPPSKQQAELKLTRDLQTLWGKLTSEYLEAGWSVVADFLHACHSAESKVLSIRNVNEILSDVIQCVEIGGRNVLVPLMNVLEKIIFRCLTTENTDTVVKLINTCWNMIFEFRKTELFWTSIEAFIQMLFHPSMMTSAKCHDYLLEYSSKIFAHGDTVSGLPNILITHLQKIVKMSTLDILEPFTPILVEALTFGPVHRRDQRVITETCKYIASLGEKCSINQLATNNCHVDSEVRARAVQLLLTILHGTSRSHYFIRTLMEELIEKDRVESLCKSRYYSNSKLHRLKHRVLQSILLLEPFLDLESADVLAKWLQNSLLREGQQPSVRYQQEWLLIRLLHHFHHLREGLWNMFQQAQEKRHGSICSFIAVVYHVAGVLTEEQEAFVDHSVQEILPWCMAQHFTVRLYAQTTLQKLFTLCRNKHLDCITKKYAVVESCLHTNVERGNAVKNAKKLEEDFYFTAFHPIQHYSLQTIFYELPRLSNITCEEWVSREILTSCGVIKTDHIAIENPDTLLKEFSAATWILKSAAVTEEDTTPATRLHDNVQKKLVPWRSMIPDCDIQSTTEIEHEQKKGLIVVASLIDRLPNLGGLSRTCEVFGASEFVVESLKCTEDKQFRSLSVTAEQWIPLSEVKPHLLSKYLEMKKKDGYTVVGAEQTARSTLLNDTKFPKKTLLLLGNEKEGIPADLLPLLDMCVEIPQQGVVRSLNVHVTGALFIWEYAKQHSVK